MMRAGIWMCILMADDTITVNQYPTCGCCKSQSDYQGYKKYTKTWKNYCPHCKKSGTLADNPKGVADGEITCSQSKGGCDADYCGFCGGDKGGGDRCKNYRLTSATATSSGTSSGTTSSSYMTFWEMLEDLQKPLDGEVEILIRDDRVYFHHVPDHSQTELFLSEGVNILEDSVTIKDFNPDTVNVLICKWGTNYDKYIVLKNAELIERFGVHAKEVRLFTTKTEYVTTTTGTDSTSSDTSTDSSSSTSSSSTSGSNSNSKTTGSGSTKKKTSKKKSTKKRTTYQTAYKGMNRKNNKSTSKTKNPTGKPWYVNLGNYIKKSIGWK